MTAFLHSLVILFVLSFLFLFSRRKYLQESTLVLLIIFLAVLLACNFVEYKENFVVSGGGLPPINVDSKIASRVFVDFLTTFPSIMGGALICNLMFKSNLFENVNLKANKGASPILFRKSLPLIISIILISFVITHFSEILSRQEYLFSSQGSVGGAVRYMCPVLSLFSIYLFFNTSNSFWNILNLLIGFSIELSTGSRSLGILLGGFFFFWALKSSNNFIRMIRVSLGCYFGIAGASLALFLRSEEKHGIIPHAKAMMNTGVSFVSISLVLGTFVVIIPVTYYGLSIKTPDDYFLTAFNPLPGRFTNWYKYANSLTLNPWTPTGGVAQVSNLGTGKAILSWCMIGFLLQFVGIKSEKSALGAILRIIAIALSLSAALQILQYSIRAGVRFIYANMIIMWILNLVNRRKGTAKSYSQSPE